MNKSINEEYVHFINSLHGSNAPVSDIKYNSIRPIYILTKIDNFNLNLTIYLYNCLNPPGGRPINEYKINLNLPGQQKGQRCNFDFNSGFTLLIGYVKQYDVFVLWDAYKHLNFAYNTNIQVKHDAIVDSYLDNYSSYTRDTNNGYETILCCTPHHLAETIAERYRIYREDLCKGVIGNTHKVVSRNDDDINIRKSIKSELDLNPRITVTELCKKLDLSRNVVKYHMLILIENGEIARTNFDKNKLELIEDKIVDFIIENPSATLLELSKEINYDLKGVFDFMNEFITGNEKLITTFKNMGGGKS